MDRTLDIVVLVLSIGLVGAGFLSIALGWVVNYFAPADLTEDAQTEQTTQTDQTDEADQAVSDADLWLDRMELDRTRTAVIELMVYTGWSTSQVRAVLKGDSGVIGVEVEAARQKLGITAPDRMLRVRDEKGERVIPL